MLPFLQFGGTNTAGGSKGHAIRSATRLARPSSSAGRRSRDGVDFKEGISVAFPKTKRARGSSGVPGRSSQATRRGPLPVRRFRRSSRSVGRYRSRGEGCARRVWDQGVQLRLRRISRRNCVWLRRVQYPRMIWRPLFIIACWRTGDWLRRNNLPRTGNSCDSSVNDQNDDDDTGP